MSKTSGNTAIVWFRRDLRINDNPALQYALDNYQAVIPIYIHAPAEEAPWEPGEASNWWLHHSLKALDKSLRERGSRLFLETGDSLAVLETLSEECQAGAVFWNDLYEPALLARDHSIKTELKRKGLECSSFNGSLMGDPDQVKNSSGQPFRVFSAWWRKSYPLIDAADRSRPLPPLINTPDISPGRQLEELSLLPVHDWYLNLSQWWQPGEAGASRTLQIFLDDALGSYDQKRDLPEMAGTSRLSPYLHFGELSPLQVLRSVSEVSIGGTCSVTAEESFLAELGWRDFAHYLLVHFPESVNRSMDRRFDHGGWISCDENHEILERWQQGRTGIPIVDAGMRQLWQTGWMHNRVRMISASLLTKNLGIHWIEGARWFWDTLVDADLANNTMGWQWTAGCGIDAAPYFRVFNPSRQAERFDPGGDYIRKWLPELSGADIKTLHTGLSNDVSLKGYPPPMVDLAQTRKQALERWSGIKVEKKQDD